MTDEIKTLIGSLDDVLDAERAALIKGELDLLSNLAIRKEALIEALNQAEMADIEALRLLDRKVKRNQDLLNNALEGIRKVARRMAAFRRVQASLETYDKDGAKSVIDINPETSVERRA